MSDDWAPRGLDVSRPSPARMYDFYLSGKEHFAVDRQAAGEVIAAFPEVPALARANRGFLQRAVRFLARERGIRQFLDLGTGLPTQGNVHEIAHATDPQARVVYVDNDPIVLVHARALLAHANPYVDVVEADLRHPDGLLADAHLNALVDFDRPVGVLCVAVLHFVADAEDPAGIVAAFREHMAPGSYLVLSHVSYGQHDREQVDAAAAIYDRTTSGIVARTREQIHALFDGFTLVEPGLVDVSQWRPEVPASATRLRVLAGVGRRRAGRGVV